MQVAKIIVITILLTFSANHAMAKAPLSIPEQLIPWKDWVLYGHEEQFHCTPSVHSPEQLQCDWPTELQLNMNDKGGTFSQSWFVQHERWVQLPGDIDNWPEDVTVNDTTALVINRQGSPRVKLKAGTYTIKGKFHWIAIPEHLTLPPHSGLVNVSLHGKRIDFPELDAQGRLWLKAKNKKDPKIENRLTVQSFRFLDDRIPLKTDVQIQLDVSGTPREVVLGPVFSMDKVVPVSLNSTLPAKLEQDGRLRIQIRPGQWKLTLTTRHIGPISSIEFAPPEDGFWPREEIWVFNSHPNLRVVEIQGVQAIDPLQTSLPQYWHKFPTYRVQGGDTMIFKEIKRGDLLPAPDQLQLNRMAWLRFDGSGYTLQDTITGTKKTNWRLEMEPPIQLGRVTVDSQEQFITTREDSDNAGVELRKGVLNLVADSEYYGKISILPATGWAHDFQQVKANLFLPPGWRLINAAGVDHVYGTWVKRWTLLDFFIVLILTLAIARLFSKPLAALAFVSLVLLYHEPNAPRWIWLAILICIALLRHLPEGRFKRSIKLLQIVNIIALALIALPFSVEQLRVGIYPQLEKPWHSMASIPIGQPQAMPPELQYEEEPVKSEIPEALDSIGDAAGKIAEQSISRRRIKKSSVDRYDYHSATKQVAQYDPSMINQTGPGLPNWKWNTIPMSWSGPVQKNQEISLLLIGPTTNLILSFVRVGLLILLTLGILNIRFGKDRKDMLSNFSGIFLIPFFLVFLLSPHSTHANQIPSPELFEDLRSRLLEKEDCFPECADISNMQLDITPEQLNLELQVAVQTLVSIPIPGSAMHWLPQEITVNGQKAKGLFRTNNQLWLLVQPGENRVVLKGKIPKQNSFQLPLPLKPHRVTSRTQGWTIEGIQENGRPDNQIQFRRIVGENSITNQILDTGVLPPFLLVERTLRLGLNWKIETVVRRISPAGSAVVFEYPLLQNESVVTEGIRVKNNSAQITLDPQQSNLHWESVLDKNDVIQLRHAETDLWTEMWRVDVSPIFHMDATGIPVILHQQGDRWYPTWHPWPGEEVTLTITRPTGIKGQTITIDKVHLDNKPGRRTTSTRMSLSIRSSQGGQHTITLPKEAQLQEVKIDGRILPIRQEKNHVTLPIKPGKQDALIHWNEPSGITSYYKSPTIDLGLNNVNCNLDIHLAKNRWPLLVGGPLMGPAVLFWSVVLVILLVAIGLSKTGLTPLKFHQWFLLGLGMSQSNVIAGLLVVAWLIALDLRNRTKPEMDKTAFNIMQIGLATLTVIAISLLVIAISQGLLGHPDMNIIGNGSHSTLLKWYQDHSAKTIPQAWIISIPMLYYRLAMLAWALWISFNLINLLKWGWKNYSEPVIWHKIPRKKKPRPTKKKETEKDMKFLLDEDSKGKET